MTRPFVSIIIPNFNHERFLKERIDSVLNQTYQNYEIIILDDCSTDNSIDIINCYKNNSHISHIIINDYNSGSPFLQWSKGIELAKGELIWIAESDDSSFPEFLEALVSELIADPEAVLAFAHSFFMDNNSILIDKDLHINSGNSINKYNGKYFSRRIMAKRCYIYNASMVVFRRTAYFKIDKNTYQKYKSCGDWVFWTSLCLQGNVIEVCKKLSIFRENTNGATAKACKTGSDWNEVASILVHYIKILSLKGLNLRLFRGKWTRDLQLSRAKNKQELIDKYPMVFRGSKTDVFLYRLSEFLIRHFHRI